MIKNYLELGEFEVENFIQFINRNKTNKLSFEDIDKEIKSEVFDFGKGVLLNIQGQDVVGTTSVVLKECSQRGIAYIVKLDISEIIADKKSVLYEMIEESKNIAKRYGAREIFLGTKDEIIIRSLNNLGIEKQYSAIRMTLDDRSVKYSLLSLVKLSNENKKEYLRIYNEAFKEIPNGATLTEGEVNRYIKDVDKNDHYIVMANNEMIGFLQFNIKDEVGEFDLGLIKGSRGKGYGKLLLETAINFLNAKKVKEISLIVITKNALAYDMYKKRGFKEKELIGDWFQV